MKLEELLSDQERTKGKIGEKKGRVLGLSRHGDVSLLKRKRGPVDKRLTQEEAKKTSGSVVEKGRKSKEGGKRTKVTLKHHCLGGWYSQEKKPNVDKPEQAKGKEKRGRGG